MAVASVGNRRPLADHILPINRDVLVVGGGVSGMNAALHLAEDGFKVYLVEQSGQLGGLARNIHRTLQGEDVQAYMTDLIEKVSHHDRIEILTNAIIVDHSGMPGMFKTGLQIGPRMHYRQIQHGATILATGAVANRPKEYLLDEEPAVVTQLDLDALIEDQPDKIKSWEMVVMIQCVGSRNDNNPNCSRVCCQTAVKNALRIIDLNPDAQVCILYRDIRTYGFQEDYFQKARDRGVMFFRYSEDAKPEVASADQQVIVTFKDQVLNNNIEITADCLALSTGFIADDEATEDLSMIFHLNRTSDGYFLEDHVKLRPVDLSTPGFLVAGTAHAPKSINESITQAQAAAGRVQAILAKETINLGAVAARVDRKKCAACLQCVRACPYHIPFINAEGCSEIDPALCHGCGTCAAECPAKAIQLMKFEDDVIMANLAGLLERLN
jgi:heterodisulfide reductase subunit A